MTTYQPKTGAPCSCRPGRERDNCPSCEGTGQRIDFAAIRAASAPESEDTSERKTLAALIAELGITATAQRTGSNPNLSDSDPMDHWLVTFRREGGQRRKLSIVFSQGYGYDGRKPEAASVLDCLLSDASGYDNARNFADWCAEYGYDENSRRAERTYRVIGQQAAKLRRFLGEHYDAAQECERL